MVYSSNTAAQWAILAVDSTLGYSSYSKAQWYILAIWKQTQWAILAVVAQWSILAL